MEGSLSESLMELVAMRNLSPNLLIPADRNPRVARIRPLNSYR